MDKKRRIKAGGEKGTMILATLIVIVAIYTIGWAVTCGIIYLITACFGLGFSWPVATGIWLILLILKSVFKNE